MKKQVLILFAFLMVGAFKSYSQIKFLSDGKEVTEYTPEMDNLKVVFSIPETAENYEELVFGIEDYLNINRFIPEYSNAIFYPSVQFKNKGTHEMWIMNKGKEAGDFCSISFGKTHCYNPIGIVKSINRDYVSAVLKVKVMGRDIERYVFNDEGEKVPVYKTVGLEMGEIKLNFGPIIMKLESNTGAFTCNKFKGTKNYSKLVEANSGETIDSYFKSNDESNEIRFRITRLEKGTNNAPVFDMSGGGGSAKSTNDVTVESTKHSIAVELMRQSVPSANKFIKEIPEGYYWNSSQELVYEPFLMSKNSDKRSDVERHFSKIESSLPWKKGKIGNLDCQLLEVKIYTKKQINNSSGSQSIKDSEVGKTFSMLFFVGENKGEIISGSMHFEGTNPISSDESSFWNYMIDKGFAVK